MVRHKPGTNYDQIWYFGNLVFCILWIKTKTHHHCLQKKSVIFWKYGNYIYFHWRFSKISYIHIQINLISSKVITILWFSKYNQIWNHLNKKRITIVSLGGTLWVVRMWVLERVWEFVFYIFSVYSRVSYRHYRPVDMCLMPF